MWIYVWLGITALALITEFLTNDMLCIWFAGGGIVAMILAVCNVPWFWQLLAFVVVSLVLLLCFRRVVLKYFMKGESRTNADAVFGKEFTLLSDIAFNTPGTIKVAGVVWNAVTKNEQDSIPAGTKVKVVGLSGNKYIVEEA